MLGSIHDKLGPQRLIVKCELSLVCAFIALLGARSYPVWHIDHTNSTTLFSEDPRAKQNAANFHDILSLPMGRKSI